MCVCVCVCAGELEVEGKDQDVVLDEFAVDGDGGCVYIVWVCLNSVSVSM